MLRANLCAVGLPVLLAASAGAAAASTYTYEYQGNDLICTVTSGECVEGELRRPAFTGTLTVDETVLPGTLMNATLRFDGDVGDGTPGSDSFEVFLGNSAGLTFADTSAELGISYEGIISETLSPVFGSSFYALQFGPDREVIDWLGDGGAQGGSNDFRTTSFGDFDTVSAAPPGRWVLTGVTGHPAPIPLPAGALLLIGGLAMLGLFPRRA